MFEQEIVKTLHQKIQTQQLEIDNLITQLSTTNIFPIEFIAWYSGMDIDKIQSAYKRYLKEQN